jgi:hypothetical protein
MGGLPGGSGVGGLAGAAVGQLMQQQATGGQPGAQPQPGLADYQSARAACLTGRGYSVR